MKILLINPNSDFLINDRVFPSLGLLYLSSYLKEHGYNDIRLLDLNGSHQLPECIEADVVGLYSNTPQFPVAVKIAKEIKKINKTEDAFYVIGGPHVSGRPDDAILDFDAIVKGEGERALLDIVRARDKRFALKGKIIEYPYESDINKFPFPDRDLIDIKGYKYFINSKLTTTLITSRGCPFKCSFCANNAWGKTLRLRSPENVFAEVVMLKEKYAYESFMFYDDTMTVNRKRMLRLCQLLTELKIIYRCFIRSDTVDRQILRSMRLSGCVEVGIGIESGSQRLLNLINKGETVARNKEAIGLCKDAGIRVKGFIIVGLPGENLESVKETTDFLDEVRLDDLDVTIYTPYPGSLIYNQKEKFDIYINDDYEHAWFKGRPGHYRSLVSTGALKAEDIVNIRDELERKFKKTNINCQHRVSEADHSACGKQV